MGGDIRKTCRRWNEAPGFLAQMANRQPNGRVGFSGGLQARLLSSAHVTGDNLVSILTHVDRVPRLLRLAAEIDSKNQVRNHEDR